MEKRDCFVSVVVVADNQRDLVLSAIPELHAHLSETFVDFEIVIVDQRSRDGTVAVLEALLTRLSAVRLIQLASPVAADVAVSAGLENAIGDFVVLMALGQDPVGCIGRLVEQCRSNSDVVYGVAPQPASIVHRALLPVRSRLLSLLGYELPLDSTKLRCLSRRAVNAVTRAGRFHHQLFVRIQKTGYPSSAFHYRQERYENRQYLLVELREAIRLLVFSSTRPMRVLGGVGMFLGGGVFLLSLYRLVIAVGRGGLRVDDVSFVLYGILLVTLFAMLTFFGEYLGRLLDERGERFTYFVLAEKNSTYLLEGMRRNVLVEEGDVGSPVPGSGLHA